VRTGSVNRVWLMGWVARPPVVRDGVCRLVVATREGERVERHNVQTSAELANRAAELATGDVVYLEGRLEHGAGTVAVAAADLWRVDESDAESDARTPLGTHASPRPHERRGHWRRVAVRTATERLVWVRATAVGGLGHLWPQPREGSSSSGSAKRGMASPGQEPPSDPGQAFTRPANPGPCPADIADSAATTTATRVRCSYYCACIGSTESPPCPTRFAASSTGAC
jgi:hypothetical protein